MEEEEIDGFGDVAHGRHEPLDTVSPRRRHGVCPVSLAARANEGERAREETSYTEKTNRGGGERNTHREKEGKSKDGERQRPIIQVAQFSQHRHLPREFLFRLPFACETGS